ncbi:hypothetical protein Pve01_23750 [Planomonospora venezuelensis]|nr:hypothetical protein Pve01_23750 [Planomonospora venezuelensis]
MEALRRADTQAPASLFDAYAERLNDYACSLLADRDGAAEAVHDALVTAQGRADLLQDAGRLRSWLYALVRSRCAARPRGGHGAAPPSLPLPAVDGHDDPRERELAALVHEVLGELGGQEREVLELSLRHDLGTGEVGAVVGLSSRQAAARLGRARDHLENAAAAVVLAKVGRAHCPDLSAMVDSWEGPLTPMLRRRLSGHIARCEVCTERRGRHVSAGRLLDMVPVVFPPLSLRRRVVETCVNPELDEVRAAIVEAGGPFDRTGFPVAGGSRPSGAAGASGSRRAVRRRKPRRSVPVIVAAVCVLAATAGMITLTGLDLSGGRTGTAEAAPGTEPAMITFAPPAEPAPSDTAPTETPSAEESPPPEPIAEGTRPAATVPVPAPGTDRRPSSRRPRATRPPTPRPAPARLAVSCPSDIGQGSGQIRLTAHNAVIEWSATASGGLVIQPARGRLRSGANGVIWVTSTGLAESGSGQVVFRSDGGGVSCAISWEAPEPAASEPPPDPSEPPSEPPSATSSPAPEMS